MNGQSFREQTEASSGQGGTEDSDTACRIDSAG